MAREQLKTLTEPMYYTLLALVEERHGYGIMQRISEITQGRVAVGAGTLYALLNRFEKEGIIMQVAERERKKFYRLEPKGEELLSQEFRRLNQLVQDGQSLFDSDGNLLPPPGKGGSGCGTEEEAVDETQPVDTRPQQEGLLGEEAPERQGGKSKKDDRKSREEKPGGSFGRNFRKGLLTT